MRTKGGEVFFKSLLLSIRFVSVCLLSLFAPASLIRSFYGTLGTKFIMVECLIKQMMSMCVFRKTNLEVVFCVEA